MEYEAVHFISVYNEETNSVIASTIINKIFNSLDDLEYCVDHTIPYTHISTIVSKHRTFSKLYFTEKINKIFIYHKIIMKKNGFLLRPKLDEYYLELEQMSSKYANLKKQEITDEEYDTLYKKYSTSKKKRKKNEHNKTVS